MKHFLNIKGLILTSFLIANSASAGLFVQGGLGIGNSNVKTNETFEFQDEVINVIQKENITGVATNIGIGYQFNSESKVKYSLTYALSMSDGDVVRNTNIDGENYRSKISNIEIVDLYSTIGYDFTKYYTGYVNLGLSATSVEVRTSAHSRNSYSGVGLMAGLGAQYKTSEKFAFFMETSVRYSKVNDSFGEGDSLDVKLINTSAVVGFRYFL
jgi:opacity protein-like surface antigen